MTANPAARSSGIGSEIRFGVIDADAQPPNVEPGAGSGSPALGAAAVPVGGISGGRGQGSLADDLVGLLAAAPNGLPCGKLARLTGRRKATVLETLRADSRFKQSGRHRGSRWTLSPDGAGTLSVSGKSVPGGQPDPEVISAVAGARERSRHVEAVSPPTPTRAEPGRPSEGRKKRPPLRRISEVREVDEVAASLGMPVTVAPDPERLVPWRRRNALTTPSRRKP